jgi:hypothetical protein
MKDILWNGIALLLKPFTNLLPVELENGLISIQRGGLRMLSP